jgi:hypothetical protein
MRYFLRLAATSVFSPGLHASGAKCNQLFIDVKSLWPAFLNLLAG